MNSHFAALITISALLLGCGGGSEEPVLRHAEEAKNGISAVENGLSVIPIIIKVETETD